jgi:hypothetical protein
MLKHVAYMLSDVDMETAENLFRVGLFDGEVSKPWELERTMATEIFCRMESEFF